MSKSGPNELPAGDGEDQGGGSQGLDSLPPFLRDGKRFVCWEYRQRKGDKKPTKVPVRADCRALARSTDPATWATFEECVAAVARFGYDGVGIILGGGLAGVDLDECFNADGAIRDPELRAFVAECVKLGGYAERSPSGTGLHVYGLAKIPEGGNARTGAGCRLDCGKVEFYDRARYFTLTGDAWPGSGDGNADIQPAVDRLHRRVFGAQGKPAPPPAPIPSASLSIGDEELLERARTAKNGDKFRALFDAGDVSGHGGDESAADLALCDSLAFWCQGDPVAVDRLFRQSALVRPKWDEKRGASTYGERTVSKALEGRTVFYSERRPPTHWTPRPHNESESLEPPPDVGACDPAAGSAVVWTDSAGTPAATAPPVTFATFRAFTTAAEELPLPLIGTREQCVLPADGLAILYGPAGSSKSTLSIDLTAHLGAGCREWLGFPIKPARVVLIESDGPRSFFRLKLARKREQWDGPEFLDSGTVLESPWGAFTLADAGHRQALAEHIDAFNADLVILGPLASVGALGPGTPEDVESFASRVTNLRARTLRRFAVILLHHLNKAGSISGAWERYPDTLMRLSLQGNGRTHCSFEKVRWSSDLHGTEAVFLWQDGGFRREEPAAARDYAGEVLAKFEPARWYGSQEACKTVGATWRKLRPVLSDLVAAGEMEYQLGPPGHARNAGCYRRSVLPMPGEEQGRAGRAEAPGDAGRVLFPLFPPCKGEEREGRAEHSPPSSAQEPGRAKRVEAEQ